MQLLLLLIALIAPVYAASDNQQVRNRVPSLGYVYDSGAGALFPVRGVPGAALVDGPVDPGFRIANAAVSPTHKYSLAVSAEDGVLRLIHLDAAPSPIAIDGAVSWPDRIVFSPSGSAALLYAVHSGRLQVLTGLPDSPAVRDLDFERAPDALAIADDGATVLLSAADELWVFYGGDARRELPISASVAAFRRASRDAVAVSRTGDVYVLTEGGEVWRQIQAGNTETEGPVAVRLSPDGAMALVGTATGTVSVFHLDTGESKELKCNCVPAGIEPLNGGLLFLLTGDSDRPLWMLDASRKSPRLWFVPRRSVQ